jgi:hypothetical protein
VLTCNDVRSSRNGVKNLEVWRVIRFGLKNLRREGRGDEGRRLEG